MSSPIPKLAALVRSPKAQKAVEQARQQLAKPENRRRIEKLRARLARRR